MTTAPTATGGGYRPGVCNIGPAEIAARRRFGHAATIATLGLLLGLGAIRAPAPARLLTAIPAAGAASGYLQARMRFCAGFGERGVYNFGDLGAAHEVADTDARALDRRRARQIGLASGVIGLLIGAVAALLPFGR